jgi:hypothetical protein
MLDSPEVGEGVSVVRRTLDQHGKSRDRPR